MNMLRKKPLWQESKLKTQRQRFSKSRKIWSMLKSREGNREPEETFYEMMVAIGDSLTDVASSDEGEDGDDEDDEETE